RTSKPEDRSDERGRGLRCHWENRRNFQSGMSNWPGLLARGRPVRDRTDLPTLRKLLLPDPPGQRPESERHKLNSAAGREDEGGPPAGRGLALQKGLDCHEPRPDRTEHL